MSYETKLFEKIEIILFHNVHNLTNYKYKKNSVSELCECDLYKYIYNLLLYYKTKIQEINRSSQSYYVYENG